MDDMMYETETSSITTVQPLLHAAHGAAALSAAGLNTCVQSAADRVKHRIPASLASYHAPIGF